MAVGATNQVALYLNPEVTWNETPSTPAMDQLRFKGESLIYGKKTIVSETIRSDRMRDQLALVQFETKGDINFELSFFDPDLLMEGALANTFTGIKTLTGTTYGITATTITDSANGLGAIAVNSYVWISGHTDSRVNTRYKVTAVAAGTLTVTGGPAITVAAGPSCTLSFSGLAVVTATSTLTVVVSGSTITFGGSTGFNPTTATGLVAGQWIRLAGFDVAGNNGIFRISALTATTIVVVGSLSADTVPAVTTLSFHGRCLRNGSTAKSFQLLKAFTDINQFISFQGMRVADLKLDVNSQQIITGAFSFMGGKAVRSGSTTAGSTRATNTSSVLTGSGSVGTILQSGSAISVGLKQITLAVNNNMRVLDQIGTLYPFAINYGFTDITGQVNAYFQDSTLYDQLINHTATEISFPMTDSVGNVYQITLPQILFSDGFPQAGSGNSDVMIPLNYQAIRSATYNCEIQIDEMPA